MAGPEDEGNADSEAAASEPVDENQVIEDTTVTEEHLDSEDVTEGQTDAAQLDDSEPPTELGEDTEFKKHDEVEEPAVERPVVEEPVQDEAVTEEPVPDVEPVLEMEVTEEPVPEVEVTEKPMQEEEEVTEEPLPHIEIIFGRTGADGGTVLEEPMQMVAVTEEPVGEEGVTEEPVEKVAIMVEMAESIDTAVKQEEPLSESQDEDMKSQKDSLGMKFLSVEPSTVGASSLDSDTSMEPITDASENLLGVSAEAPTPSEEFVVPPEKQIPKEPIATVRVMLHPDIQVFTMPFNMNKTMEQMKQYFAARLKLPPNILQLMLLGRIIENSDTLWHLGVKPLETIQFDMFSLDEDQFPIIASKLLNEYYMPDVITVRVQTDPDTFQDLHISIKRPSFKKPFLGGFRNKETGVEYHNAGSQTIPKKRPDKGYEEFCRSTQTVFERKKLMQTTSPASTQMTKIGVYVSNITDKLREPKGYITADEYHARRLEAIIVIQKNYRRWHAVNVVKQLKEQLRLRLEWEAQEQRRIEREKAERLMRDYNRRMFPRTRDDFELLYHALEMWRQEELERINSTFSGAERKAALCALLEKEAQLIASIGRHKLNADELNQQQAIMAFLEKEKDVSKLIVALDSALQYESNDIWHDGCAEPKRWKAFDGKITEMDTQFTLRARELLEIYRSISMTDLPPDERLDVLLTLKHTVKEHECKLTHEIMDLIDREADLMMRGVKDCNLEGLRKRICTLFLQYIKTPFFNPEVARLLKVPPDPIRLYHNIHFCLGCKRYLPSTDFAISGSSHTVGRCRLCCQLDNEARKREAFFNYKRMLRNLRRSEVNYMDGAKIAFVLQLQDLQYMVENFWGSQSALSAWDDLYDLVMVRWDKQVEWSPWNAILLKTDEAESHLKLKDLDTAYEPVFVHRIKHKHLLARNYFSQFPELGKTLHKDDDKMAYSNELAAKSGPPKPVYKIE